MKLKFKMAVGGGSFTLKGVKPMTFWLQDLMEAVWLSGQHTGLTIWWSWVRVPLWPLTGFVLGRPKFKSLATIVNSPLVASCQLGSLILLCCI